MAAQGPHVLLSTGLEQLAICRYSLVGSLADEVDLREARLEPHKQRGRRRGRPGPAPTLGRISFSSAACCKSFAPEMILIRSSPSSWRNSQTAFHPRRSGSRYTVQWGSRGAEPGHRNPFQWPNGAAAIATRVLGSTACRREGRRRSSAIECRARRDETVHARSPIPARREIILSASAAPQYVDEKTRQRQDRNLPRCRRLSRPYDRGPTGVAATINGRRWQG